MSLRATFRKGIRWQVGNGVKISFWFDNWVYAFPLVDLFQDQQHDVSLKVSDFISRGNQWMVSKLENFVLHNMLIKHSKSIHSFFCYGIQFGV